MALAQPSDSYHCGDKVWIAVEDKKMEIPGGAKVPLGNNRRATHRKLYLRHNLFLFNAFSLVDIYTHI